MCLEGVVQSWSESKVEENQSQIGERVSWRQATTRRAAGLHHIFQSLKAEEEDRVKRVNILAKPIETGPQMYLQILTLEMKDFAVCFSLSFQTIALNSK